MNSLIEDVLELINDPPSYEELREKDEAYKQAAHNRDYVLMKAYIPYAVFAHVLVAEQCRESGWKVIDSSIYPSSFMDVPAQIRLEQLQNRILGGWTEQGSTAIKKVASPEEMENIKEVIVGMALYHLEEDELDAFFTEFKRPDARSISMPTSMVKTLNITEKVLGR